MLAVIHPKTTYGIVRLADTKFLASALVCLTGATNYLRKCPARWMDPWRVCRPQSGRQGRRARTDQVLPPPTREFPNPDGHRIQALAPQDQLRKNPKIPPPRKRMGRPPKTNSGSLKQISYVAHVPPMYGSCLTYGRRTRPAAAVVKDGSAHSRWCCARPAFWCCCAGPRPCWDSGQTPARCWR